MRVGILSDTHGLLRLQVKDVLKTCDVILHGGDINREDIIKELEAFAPLYVAVSYTHLPRQGADSKE